MAAYDDNNWLELLKGLHLTPNNEAAAKLLLFDKSAAYRKMMLNDDEVSNRTIILLALGESSWDAWRKSPDPGSLCSTSTLRWSMGSLYLLLILSAHPHRCTT